MNNSITYIDANYIEYTIANTSIIEYRDFIYTQCETYNNIIIYFYSDVCPYCVKLHPYFIEKIHKLQEHEKFAKNTLFIQINGSIDTDIYKYERIKGFPTVINYKNGERDQIVVGLNKKDLDACIFNYSNLVPSTV